MPTNTPPKKKKKKKKWILRGTDGPTITLKQHKALGYLVYRKFFMQEPELIGSVRRASESGPYKHLWFAFPFTDLEAALAAKDLQLTYAKGITTRKLAVAHLCLFADA